MRTAALGLGVLLGACVKVVAPPVVTPTDEPESAAEPQARPDSSPHVDDIIEIVLDPRGRGAITRDSAEQLRLWTRLDGESGPVAVPLATPKEHIEHIDLLSEEDGWRFAVQVDDRGLLFEADRRGFVHRVAAYDGVSSLAVLPGRRTLVAQPTGIVLRGPQGVERTLPTDGPATLLLTPERDAVVAVVGDWKPTKVLQYWQIDPYLSVFDGAVIPLALDDGGLTAARAPIPFTSGIDIPGAPEYALAPDASQLSLRAWHSLDGESEMMLEMDIVTLDLQQGTQSRVTLEDSHADWVAYTEDSVLIWDGRTEGDAPWSSDDGSERMGSVSVRSERNWLHVRDEQGERYLGVMRFEPHAVAFSPDGQRQAWVTNSGEEDPPSLHFTRLDDDAVGPSFELPDLGVVTAVAWPEDDAVLLADRQGQLYVFDPASGTPTPLGRIEGEPAAFEHDPAGGLTLVRDPWNAIAVVPWEEGQPLPTVSLQPLVSQELRVGLVHGSTAVWALGLAGLATLTLAQLRRGASPKFEPLDPHPLQVFDIAWTTAGGRVIDWGDRWQITAEAEHEWLRDTPVFGPLLAAPGGNGVLTLPECAGYRQEPDWEVAVHPRAPATLGAGASWLMPVVLDADVRWSPDGTMLAVAEGRQGGRIVDVATRKDLRRFLVGPWQVRQEPAPGYLKMLLGRCRGLDDLWAEDDYG